MTIAQLLLFGLIFSQISLAREVDPIDYRQAMRDFVQNISAYARSIRPDFIVIPQNGIELITNTGDPDGPLNLKYLFSIDGLAQEDLFYGYEADDQRTPSDVTETWIAFLDRAKNNRFLKRPRGPIQILVTDYCFSPDKVDQSYAANQSKGYVSFAADQRELNHIPDYPDPIRHQNENHIDTLQSVQNFLYLIAPDDRYDQQSFVNAIKQTDYDLIIMDLFFDGQPFNSDQIAQLHQKANGSRRLLLSYMSIGEAEDYRDYWQSDWQIGHPDFIDSEDPDWPGNYYVHYWDADWQRIIFDYLDRIIAAGFDGVYLDIIDAFEYFESND